jgi:hypothetical protein
VPVSSLIGPVMSRLSQQVASLSLRLLAWVGWSLAEVSYDQLSLHG